MRALLAWFNARRRLVALATIGLIAVAYLSAGPAPETGEWARIPDLSGLLVVVAGSFAVLMLVLIAITRPRVGMRKRGEVRSIRTVLVLTLVIAAAAVWFSPSEATDDSPPIAPEETATQTGGEVGIAPDAETGASGIDIAALVLILLIVAIVIVRRSLTSPPPPETTAEDDRALRRELAPAVEQAQHRLAGETDPRTGVLLAYASLEHALAEMGHERRRADTPGEHMARVLADFPTLANPAVRLGELYEVARFSQEAITEDDRQEAARALDRIRGSLRSAGSGAT